MRSAIIVCVFSFLMCCQASCQNFAPTAEGDALFAKQDWAGAAREFKLVAEQNPHDGHAWFRLGSSLYRMGSFPEAATAFQHAADNQFQTPVAMAAAARAYASADNPAQTLVWLEKAAKAGFGQTGVFDSSPAMSALKLRPEFAPVRETILKNSKPCENTPEYQQFDFWLGEWDVQVAGQTVARSRIEKIDAGCIVQENWMPLNGGEGKSWNYYDAATGKWEQLWMSAGGLLRLKGEMTGGAMVYRGVTPQPNGPTIQQRVTFTPLEGRRVHQLWDQSTDEGKTWTVTFDGIYLPHESKETSK